MSESEEAKWLRFNWNEEHLGQYQNNWIAVRGQDVIANSDNFKGLIYESRIQELEAGEKPLYAFVYFGELQ